jgi:hypothetical protein
VVDISDPYLPQIINGIDYGFDVYQARISGNYAFVSDSHGLTVINISNPLNLIITGEIEIELNIGSKGLSVSGNYALLANGVLYFLDISNPANPRLLSTFENPIMYGSFDVSGSIACISDILTGLKIADVSDPQKPQMIGGLEIYIGRYPIWREVNIQESFAYVESADLIGEDDTSCSWEIVDLRNPSSPKLVRQVDLGLGGGDLKPYDDYLYIIHRTRGDDRFVGQVWDISNPLNAHRLSIGYLDGGYDNEFKDEYLYSYNGELFIYSLNNPIYPQLINSANIGAYVMNFIVNDNLLITLNSWQMKGVYIYDMTNPIDPVYIGQINPDNSIYAMEESEGFLYTCQSDGNLIIYDFRGPEHPVLFSSLPVPAWDLEIRNNYAYVAGSEGLFVVELW